MTQQYCFASMAAQLSSTGISHDSLLPHVLSICLSAVSSSPRPGIAPLSPNPSSQPLYLPGDLCSHLGCVWLWQRLSYSHSISVSSLTQSYLTLCNPKDCSPPGSSVHGIFQATVMERVIIPFSRGSSQSKDQTSVSCIISGVFTV